MTRAQRFHIVGQRHGRSAQPLRQAVHLSNAQVDVVEARVQGDRGGRLLSMKQAAAELGYEKPESVYRFLRRRGVSLRFDGMKGCRVLASDVAAIVAEATVGTHTKRGSRRG